MNNKNAKRVVVTINGGGEGDGTARAEDLADQPHRRRHDALRDQDRQPVQEAPSFTQGALSLPAVRWR